MMSRSCTHPPPEPIWTSDRVELVHNSTFWLLLPARTRLCAGLFANAPPKKKSVHSSYLTTVKRSYFGPRPPLLQNDCGHLESHSIPAGIPISVLLMEVTAITRVLVTGARGFVGHHSGRLARSIKPSLIGLWQLKRYARVADFEEVLKLDCEHTDNCSLWLDCKITAITPVKVISGTT